jgi:anti-sigma factor RsiW
MGECTNGELRDLLPELVNARLDPAMSQTVEAHVASCMECAEELALLRSLRPALKQAPTIDTQRIAAAVRAQIAGDATRAPAGEGIGTRWKVAIAAAALLAVSTIGYVAAMHRGESPSVAVAPTPRDVIRDTLNRSAPAAESVRAPIVTSPQQVAVAPPHVTAPEIRPGTLATAAVLDNVSDLSDDDVRSLTASLDKISSVPAVDASSDIDPLGATLEDNSEGGS